MVHLRSQKLVSVLGLNWGSSISTVRHCPSSVVVGSVYKLSGVSVMMLFPAFT